MAQAPDSLPPEVLAAFKRGQILEAVRLLLARQVEAARQGYTAAERPSAVSDKLPNGFSRPITKPLDMVEGLSPGEVPPSRSALWIWIVVGLLAYVVWRLV